MSGARHEGGIAVPSAAALVAANMIGAGVFTSSGYALADLGSPGLVLLAWAVGGVIALCGALSYAGLAAAIPGNGGEYLFLSRMIHPLVGFLAGWISLLAGFTAPIAVAAHGLEAYAGASFGFELPSGWLGAGAIVLAGLAHGLARGTGLRLQDLAVALKLLAIGVFVLVGGAAILWSGGAPATVDAAQLTAETAALTPAAPPGFSLSAFAVTLVWISFAYSGWNAAVYIAGELVSPEHTLPRALYLGTAGVSVLYLALNAVFLFAAPVSELAGKAEVGAIAAEALGGAPARAALSAIVALGLFTSISAMVMVGPRVYVQMAEDGLLPQFFSAAETVSGSGSGASPSRAIAVQVVLALAVFFLSDLRDLLLYVGALLGLSAAATVACLFTPQFRARELVARVPGYPWVPLIFLGATLGSTGFLLVKEPAQAVAGGGTLALGVVLYAIATRSGRIRPR